MQQLLLPSLVTVLKGLQENEVALNCALKLHSAVQNSVPNYDKPNVV